MVNTADQIETHIEETRETLGSNIEELEQKVKSVTDWRHHFQNTPMTMMGIAFGGGVVLAKMLGGRKRQRSSSSHSEPDSYTPRAQANRQKHKAMETLDNVKGALIGVAATRLKDFVEEIVPGFKDQFHRTVNAKSAPSPGASY